MAIFDVFGSNIIYAFVILAPGFLTYRIARHVGKVTVQVDTFNKTAWTILASGFSTSILILAYWKWGSQSLNDILTVPNQYSTENLAIAYLALIGISIVTGILAGIFRVKILLRGRDPRRESVWELLFKHAEQPIEGSVFTSGGTEIRGFIETWDTRGHGQDVLVKFPEVIFREGGEITNEVSIGDNVFISQADISQVYFEQELEI